MEVRNIYGQNVVVTINKSRGLLKISLRQEGDFYSYKTAMVLGAISLLALFLHWVLLMFLGYVLWRVVFGVKEESLLLVKGVGYQISRTFFRRSTTTFIPHDNVKRVFINEHRVIFLLSLIVQEKNQPKLVLLFDSIMPKLDCLEPIFRNIKQFEDG